MKYLSAVVLFSLSSVVLSQGGYPDYIDIEKQIVTFLSYENGDVFCTAVMISKDKGACNYDCVRRLHAGPDIYALVEKEGNEKRVPMKLVHTPRTFGVTVFELDGNTGRDDKFYTSGLSLTQDIGPIPDFEKLTMYGYGKRADCQPPDNWFIASAKVIPFHPDSIENNEVTFTIHLSKDHVYSPKLYWESGAVFYGRHLFALCEELTYVAKIRCNKMSKEVVKFLLYEDEDI